MSVTPPPNITEPRKEWRDWFDSLYRAVSGFSGTSFFSSLNAHIADLSNPHAVTWAQIVESGSTIDSIQNKSHTLLDDVGVNSHVVIDAHIENESNPHNVNLDDVYSAGSSSLITNRDPARYALLGA